MKIDMNNSFNHKLYGHKWSQVTPGEVTRTHRSQIEVWRRVEDPEVRAEHGAAGQDGHGAQVARGVAVVGGAEHRDHALLVTPASPE